MTILTMERRDAVYLRVSTDGTAQLFGLTVRWKNRKLWLQQSAINPAQNEIPNVG
jgi:hypothetical protein